MTEAFDEMKFDPPLDRSASESGLASILMGGVLSILAMLTLQLNLRLFLSPPVWGPADLRLLQQAAIGGGVVLILLCAISTSISVRGLFSGYRCGTSTALAWAGLLLSLLALLLWIGAAVDLYSVVDTMLQRQGIRLGALGG
jgi:hypothetical protein